LLRGVNTGFIDLYLYPVPLVTTISARPVASEIARRQAEEREPLANLHHVTIALGDPVASEFLTLVDGTRDADQLVVDLARRMEERGLAKPDKPITRADVDHHLKVLARHALLVG